MRATIDGARAGVRAHRAGRNSRSCSICFATEVFPGAGSVGLSACPGSFSGRCSRPNSRSCTPGLAGGEGLSEAKHLPVKFYIDIVDEVFEVSGPRRDFVTQRLPEILGSEGSRAIEDFIELGNRLHAGSLMGDARRLVAAIRSDYIGWEVDRFFRATKFALPCVVTVGQALFEEVIDVSEASDEGLGGTGLQKMVVACPIHQGGGTRDDHRFRYVKKAIRPAKLKGVGEGYAVYRVLCEFDLLGLRHSCADEAIMEKTFKVFTAEMERAVRAAGQA